MGELCRRLLLCLAAITAGCASPDAPPLPHRFEVPIHEVDTASRV